MRRGIIANLILHDPLVQEFPAIVERNEAANSIAHDRFHVMRGARHLTWAKAEDADHPR